MEKRRETKFLMLFSIYTSINIFLVYKIKGSKELRDSWQTIYLRDFHWWDLGVFVVLFVLVYILTKLFVKNAVPKIRTFYARHCSESDIVPQSFFTKTFTGIFAVWFVFFLAFYPGTAMNDTIYILESPVKMSSQHPVLYNLYLYMFYRIGCLLHNPNMGLAFISLLQMTGMAIVLTRAIVILRRKCASKWLCRILIIYFGISPVFPTYAVSAVKDTPFSICLFALLILLYELAGAEGALLSSVAYRLRLALCMFGVISFRNNGTFIILGLAAALWLIYKRHRKQIVILSVGVITAGLFISRINAFMGNEPLFQERIGIPLQQTAAVVVKGKTLLESEKEYLYRLLPEEKWQLYAPGCSDILKWDDEFDRQYLNQTRKQFMQIWAQLLIRNPKVCAEAYLLNTYGIWGIETRNKEQYYNKEIYENTLGLYQDSPLPMSIWKIIYVYYCNRFTYRYLSMGTAYWLFFAVTLWLFYKRSYQYVTATVPLWLLFLSLLLATPIAFAFRYGFVIAMVFPFYICVYMSGTL